MAPKGLKIGDIFEEQGRFGVIRNKIIGFDGQGNYLAEMITDEKEVSVEEYIQEELPFTMPDDELDEVQPVVEEEKKLAPKKTTKRKTTAKKTSKK